MSNVKANKKPAINELQAIIAQLRGVDGCPWDRKQTPASLTPYIIEEAYELVDAIQGGDPDEICEELGDLLLQVVLQAQIAGETGLFNFNDIAQGITDKIIRRHPHVFGEETATDEEEALQHWERIKADKEGRDIRKRHRASPILHRAMRLQEQAAAYGFDWEEVSQLFEKLDEEIGEVQTALGAGDKTAVTEEVGDLLFMAVNLARFLEIHPEEALELSIEKFQRRFQVMEMMALEKNRPLDGMDVEEMERFWQAAKSLEKRHNRSTES